MINSSPGGRSFPGPSMNAANDLVNVPARPCVAHFGATRSINADKRCLVVESVPPDTTPRQGSTVPAPTDGVGA